MERLAFLGPTLARARAEAIAPDLRLLPPAQHGDVLDAVHRYAPVAIGLVDGYFRQHASVWHKELLWALSRGIRVYGAASMGALRAAELERYGMIGIGRVFEAYRRGALPPFDGLTDDDAVAVSHGPADTGYLAVSDALVDIDATLAIAIDARVISETLGRSLLDIARALPFERRRYQTVIDLARDALAARRQTSARSPSAVSTIDDDIASLGCLTDWLPAHRRSVKRQDAEQLLSHMQSITASIERMPVAFEFERTDAFVDAEAASAQRRSAASLSRREQAALVRLRREPDTFTRIASLAGEVRRQLADIPVADSDEMRAAARRFRDRHRLFDRESVIDWLERHDLVAADFDRLMQVAARLDAESIGGLPEDKEADRLLLDVARLTGDYPGTLNTAPFEEERTATPVPSAR